MDVQGFVAREIKSLQVYTASHPTVDSHHREGQQSQKFHRCCDLLNLSVGILRSQFSFGLKIFSFVNIPSFNVRTNCSLVMAKCGNFCIASPNQWQSISSPHCHSSAASYVITLLQQLADLRCVSHFAAVYTTVTSHCRVALFVGNVHLIGLCVSQGHVACWSLLLQTWSCYIIIIIIIFIPLHATVPSTHSCSLSTLLTSLWLVFLDALSLGDL